MKGIVLSVKRRQFSLGAHHYTPRIHNFSIKRFLSFYGVQSLFFIVLVLGVILGSFSFSKASDDLLAQLDFMFVTNLASRLELSGFDVFCSSFTSDFIFILSAFLLSFTVWGTLALPLLCAFKGFGIGISSAYMFSQYSVTGIGFYILVILPGTVLFLLTFITALKEAFSQSALLFKLYFSPSDDTRMLRFAKTYMFRNFIILIFTVLSAIVDMILWIVFANMFNF